LARICVANPAGYYVNVHTTAHPGGAIRGQLGNTVPVEVPEVPWGPLLPVSAVAVGAMLIIVQRNRRLPRPLGS
jgi:CHRD domain